MTNTTIIKTCMTTIGLALTGVVLYNDLFVNFTLTPTNRNLAILATAMLIIIAGNCKSFTDFFED